jgi:hypothetical protein
MISTIEHELDLAEGLTGLAYNTLYYVYFDDANFFGGAVAYQATTNKEVAIEAAGRLFVGSIFTPPAGAPDTIGNGDGGSGAQSGIITQLSFQNIAFTATGTNPGQASVSNLSSANDGNFTDYATLSVAASGASAISIGNVKWSSPPPMNQRFSSVSVTIYYKITANNGAPNPLSADGVNIGITWGVAGLSSVFIPNPTTDSGIQAATFSVTDPSTVNLATLGAFCNVDSYEDTSGGVTAQLYGALIFAAG